MIEFLVEIRVTGAEDLSPAQLDLLSGAEALRAAELAAEGTLLRLWRTGEPGWGNLGLWQAPSEADLRAAIGSLPFAPYLDVVLTPLREHPNDPR